MPIHFSIDPAARLVTYTVEGAPTGDMAREFLDAVLADRRFRRGFGFLGSGTGPGEPDAAYAVAIAGEVLARLDLLGPCRWAVAVPSEAGSRAVRRRAALARTGGVQVVPFLRVTEAMAWLGEAAAGRHALAPA
jgi:hypothetical protein